MSIFLKLFANHIILIIFVISLSSIIFFPGLPVTPYTLYKIFKYKYKINTVSSKLEYLVKINASITFAMYEIYKYVIY